MPRKRKCSGAFFIGKGRKRPWWVIPPLLSLCTALCLTGES